MMPSTVPKRPMNGALLPSVPRNDRKRSYWGRSRGDGGGDDLLHRVGALADARRRPSRMTGGLHALLALRRRCAPPSSSPRASAHAPAPRSPAAGGARSRPARSSITAMERTERHDEQPEHPLGAGERDAEQLAGEPADVGQREDREGHGVGVRRPRSQTDSTVQAASADAHRLHPPGLVVARPDDVGGSGLGVTVGGLERPPGEKLVLQPHGVGILYFVGSAPLPRVPQVQLVGEVLAGLQTRSLEQLSPRPRPRRRARPGRPCRSPRSSAARPPASRAPTPPGPSRFPSRRSRA